MAVRRKGPQMIPCRICGDPTKVKGTYNHPRYGKLCCPKDECKKASNELRVAAILKTKLEKYGTAPKATCRVCNGPTKYHKSLQGLISCDKEECKKVSKERKYAAISATATKRYTDGTRKKLPDNWNGVARVSTEELILKDRLVEAGWKPQHMFITGLKGIHVPRTFWLDFAKPEKKLCLEVDGSVHRLGHVIVKDRRRDEILREQGWQILHITSKQVREDPEAVITTLKEWNDGIPPCESVEPQPKLCEICNNVVDNPDNRFCSDNCRHIWHSKQLRGRPSPRKGIKTGDPSKWSYIPCRICGGPTTIAGTPKHPRWGKLACDKPECRAESRLMTNRNQSKALKGNAQLKKSTLEAWTRRKQSKEIDIH